MPTGCAASFTHWKTAWEALNGHEWRDKMFHAMSPTIERDQEALVLLEERDVLLAIAAAREEGFLKTEKSLIELLRAMGRNHATSIHPANRLSSR